MGTVIALLFRTDVKMNGRASGTSSEVFDTYFQFSPALLLSPINQTVLTHLLFLTWSSLHVTVFCSVVGQQLEHPLICQAFENKTAAIPGPTNDTPLMLLSLATSPCCRMLPFRVLYELRGYDKSRLSEL